MKFELQKGGGKLCLFKHGERGKSEYKKSKSDLNAKKSNLAAHRGEKDK